MRKEQNHFRMTADGSLDKIYLRAMVIYKLLKNERITAATAYSLANRRICGKYVKKDWLNSTIDIWIKDLNRKKA